MDMGMDTEMKTTVKMRSEEKKKLQVHQTNRSIRLVRT